MRFSTLAATSATVAGALAQGYYETPVYYTSAGAVYTSIKTCTETPAAPTKPAVYGVPSSAPYVAPYPAPTSAPAYEAPSYGGSEVTYTSYDLITVTSCADYVPSCPAVTYTSTAYSVYAPPAYSYVPPSNSTTCTDKGDTYAPPTYAVPPVYETPAPSPPVYETPVYTPKETLTTTYYTTVCPGKDYCYATTITSTWCPGATPAPEHPTAKYTPAPVPTYVAPPPVYSSVVPPPKNVTTPTYVPPPSYTGAASANAVSFGVAAIAGFVALFIAA
ncbi:hypothetical protein DRE_01373 [Drechslerella stenobrocha 248]|uniref:Uncharacterized protein n=1 Tax=Drechslerella stenobrocha 248 TaxID=1043628 RepID=W7HJC6_9PEZI|nr:hypothetical protein DRE_01373 [Drechslerella stenobrocha 248]